MPVRAMPVQVGSTVDHVLAPQHASVEGMVSWG